MIIWLHTCMMLQLLVDLTQALVAGRVKSFRL